MGLFSKLFERMPNDIEQGSVKFDDPLLTALIAGECSVTKEQAMQIPTINACVHLIADRLATLPIKLYERLDDGNVKEITDDKRVELLNGDTGDTINATEMRKHWVEDYFLGKGSYTYIERNGRAEITGLYYVDESTVAIKANADPIHKEYAIIVNGKAYFPYHFLKIMRYSDGKGKGKSIIEEDPIALSISYNTMKFENGIVRKGGNKKGFLKSQQRLSPEAMKTLKEAWGRMYANTLDSADNVVVLNDGVDFQEASNTSVEMQLNQNKLTNAKELCKLFCLPSEILSGNANAATQSQAVQNCYTPLINVIEAALDADMLYEHEKKTRYFALDTTELTRGDFESRMRGYATALQNNIYQLDEVRKREDLPELGFNYIKLGLQDVLLDPKSKTVYTPNTKEMVNLDSKPLNGNNSDEVIDG